MRTPVNGANSKRVKSSSGVPGRSSRMYAASTPSRAAKSIRDRIAGRSEPDQEKRSAKPVTCGRTIILAKGNVSVEAKALEMGSYGFLRSKEYPLSWHQLLSVLLRPGSFFLQARLSQELRPPNMELVHAPMPRPCDHQTVGARATQIGVNPLHDPCWVSCHSIRQSCHGSYFVTRYLNVWVNK